MATHDSSTTGTPFQSIEGGIIIDAEASRRQQEITARQMTQRAFKRRPVILQHANGLPMLSGRPKLTKKQREHLRRERIASHRRFRKDHPPCPATPS
ncbi:MAG: hypothetical protein WC655_29815 [Candidatus Hydrogenedentales bacterium]|jgi:hypothetical protein